MSFEAEFAFLELIGNVLNNKKVNSLPEGISAEEIYKIGFHQNMIPLTFCALSGIKGIEKNSFWQEFQKKFFSDCTRSEVQLSEYDKLIPYLCENGVKILPLKGCVIKRLYYSPNLRVMSDIDLLYDGVTVNQLVVLMEKFGYSTENIEKNCHDVFHKKPCMNVELHRKLLPDNSPYKSILYNMFDKAVPDEKISNLYHQKPEDLYIHVIVHAAKHLKASGLGIRPICDIYVLNKIYKDTFDRTYINETLSSVNLNKFEEKLHTLANSFFGENGLIKENITQVDMELLFRGGTYGKKITTWEYMGHGHSSKIGYFFNRLFLPYNSMTDIFPILRKAPVLLPFLWIYRPFDILFHRRYVIKNVLGDIKKIDKSETELAKTIVQNYGLD